MMTRFVDGLSCAARALSLVGAIVVCELRNEKTGSRLDAVEHRLTQIENGLEVIAQQLSEAPETFLSKDRKMIGFSIG